MLPGDIQKKVIQMEQQIKGGVSALDKELAKMKRIIIAGGRDFSDFAGIEDALESVMKMENLHLHQIIVVSGCAPGADTLGIKWANQYSVSIEKFPADWDAHGKAAGPIRNREMAKAGDILVAFWDGRSRGTKNMIDEMAKLKKIVYKRTYSRT